MKAEMFNLHFWIKVTDPKKLKKYFKRLLAESGFGLVKFTQFHFAPQGFSCVWIISESHFAIHTWPEEGIAACDLGSCNYEKFMKFKELLSREMVDKIEYEDD